MAVIADGRSARARRLMGRADGEVRVLTPEDEAKAVSMVAERLEESFPQVPADQVQHVVHRSYEEFTGRPIRDFVPVLVERMARNDLRATVTGSLQTTP